MILGSNPHGMGVNFQLVLCDQQNRLLEVELYILGQVECKYTI